MKIGDKIKIVYYNNFCDGDLLEWAENQGTDIFEITEINEESKVFYIKGCPFGIPFDSDDYVLRKEV